MIITIARTLLIAELFLEAIVYSFCAKSADMHIKHFVTEEKRQFF